MALAKQSYIFSVKQLKIYKLLTDDDQGMTYSTGIEIPQVKKLHFKPNFETYQCKHNGKTTDQFNELIDGEWALEGNLLDLDVIALLEGDTLTTTGTEGTEKHSLALESDAEPPYFKIEAKVKYTGKNTTVKDAHFVIPKCIAGGVETNLEEAQYSSFPVSGKALVPVNGANNAKIRTIDLYAAETALTA